MYILIKNYINDINTKTHQNHTNAETTTFFANAFLHFGSIAILFSHIIYIYSTHTYCTIMINNVSGCFWDMSMKIWTAWKFEVFKVWTAQCFLFRRNWWRPLQSVAPTFGGPQRHDKWTLQSHSAQPLFQTKLDNFVQISPKLSRTNWDNVRTRSRDSKLN